MIRLYTPAGFVSGRSFSDVVQEMMTGKLRRARSPKRFRKSVARRAQEAGMEIDPTDDRSFIKSGIDSGLFERLS